MRLNSFVPLEDAKKHIEELDFTNIINKLVNYQGWRRKDAIAISRAYKNFLYLNKKYSAQYTLPPSEEIDEFWHSHILDTKQYQKDCKKIFGEYLEHYPYFGIDHKSTLSDLQKAFAKTQELYLQEFGIELTKIKNRLEPVFSMLRRKIHRLNFRNPSFFRHFILIKQKKRYSKKGANGSMYY